MGARDAAVLADIKRLRRRGAWIIWAEMVIGAVALPGFIMLAYTALALFGFGTPWAFGGTAFASAVVLLVSLTRLRFPGGAAIDRRIEAASRLRHRPLAALDDTPATSDPLALRLWQTHQIRIAESLAGARTGYPALQSAVRDPFAWRAFLLLLLITGIVVAGADAPARLATGFALPAWPFAGPSLNAWVTPPAFTGLPPYLLSPGEAVTALPGAALTVIVNGPESAPPISLGRAKFTIQTLAQTSHRADATITSSGILKIGPWWDRLGRWTVTVTPPGAPVIHLDSVAQADAMHLSLGFHVADPYGLANFSARLQPVGPPDALGETFALPLSVAAQTVTLDLSAAPFAGLNYTFILTAHNLAGVAASLTPKITLTLAAPALHDKTALALQKLRQTLALYPGRAPIIGMDIRHIARLPPSPITYPADLELAFLAGSMSRGFVSPEDASQRLGSLIKEIEAGPDYAPAQALAASDQALMDALARGLHGQPPAAAEMQQLLQAMQQALAQHLSALRPPGPNGAGDRTLDMSALKKLAQQIAADEAAGNIAKAGQEMRQLQAALNALQSARPMTAQQAAQAQAAQQAAQGIAQLLNSEAGLLNETQQGTASPDEQAGLRAALSQIQQSLQQAGIKLPGLRQAGQRMDEARNALSGQDNAGAAQAETGAIQSLQQAAAALAEAQRKGGFGLGGQPMPAGSPAGTGVNGLPDDDSFPNFALPNNPADAIEQQIMKQDSQPGLPAATHKYFQRLLEPDAP